MAAGTGSLGAHRSPDQVRRHTRSDVRSGFGKPATVRYRDADIERQNPQSRAKAQNLTRRCGFDCKIDAQSRPTQRQNHGFSAVAGRDRKGCVTSTRCECCSCGPRQELRAGSNCRPLRRRFFSQRTFLNPPWTTRAAAAWLNSWCRLLQSTPSPARVLSVERYLRYEVSRREVNSLGHGCSTRYRTPQSQIPEVFNPTLLEHRLVDEKNELS